MPRSDEATMDRIQEIQGGSILGYILSWDIHQEVELDREEATRRAFAAGLRHAFLPAPTPEVILDRTLEDIRQKHELKTAKVCKVTDTESKVLVGVLKHGRHDIAAHDVTFGTERRIWYHRKLASRNEYPWVFHRYGDDRAEALKQAEESRERVEYYETHATSIDLSAGVFRATVDACSGIAVRSHGGVYFVFARHKDAVDQMRAFMAELSTESFPCTFRAIPVYDDPQSRGDIWSLAFEEMMGEVKQIERELTEKTRKGGIWRDRTIALRLQAANKIGSKAALYRDTLQVQAQQLTDAIDRLRGAFQILAAEAQRLPGQQAS
jgi:uncharacterized protein DUF6744